MSAWAKVKLNRSNSRPPRLERNGSSTSDLDIIFEKKIKLNVTLTPLDWQPGVDFLSFPELSQQLFSASSPIWPQSRSLSLELSPKLAVRVFLHWLEPLSQTSSLQSFTIHIVGTERLTVSYIFAFSVTPTSCPVSASLPAAPPFIYQRALTHTWPVLG